MNTEETIAAVNALNWPDAKNDGMVYQVFEDGEITLQKGGSLLWQRNLHCISMGNSKKSLPARALVNHMTSAAHSYIFARDHTTALIAQRLIFDREGD